MSYQYYHPAPLSHRVPVEGRIPMTLDEWLNTPTTVRSSGTQNPFIYMVENTGATIMPVLITTASQIQIREVARA